MVESNHSDEDLELDKELEGLALSDVDDFVKLPIWRAFVNSNARKFDSLSDRLIMGDVAIYVQADPNDYLGFKHRTNDSLRGGTIELAGIDLFISDVRASITDAQEELQNQEEETLEDV